MRLYHTSPDDALTYDPYFDGPFEGVIFLASEPYSLSEREQHVYVIEIDEDVFIERYRYEYLSELPMVSLATVSERFGCEADRALALLAGSERADDYEDDWWLQAEAARAAVELGYVGVQDEDEQGAVWALDLETALAAGLTPVDTP